MVTTLTLPDFGRPVFQVARTDVVRLAHTETVGDALARLRREGVGERVLYFYVTDDGGRLVGVVPTRRLLLAPLSTIVGEIMIHPVESVTESETLGNALERLSSKRFLALPTVDAEGRLKGVLDVSLFTGQLLDLERRETADEIFQLAGVHLEQQRNRTPWAALRNRFPWLLCNVASGIAAAFLSNAFDSLLRTVVALSFFVPLVLTLAESVAMQSVAMSVQSLQTTRRALSGRGLLRREVRTGLLLGMLSAAIVAAAAATLSAMPVAAVVAASTVVACVVSAFLGYAVPRLVHRWNLDPRVASGPAVLALADIAALFCYFGLGAALLV